MKVKWHLLWLSINHLRHFPLSIICLHATVYIAVNFYSIGRVEVCKTAMGHFSTQLFSDLFNQAGHWLIEKIILLSIEMKIITNNLIINMTHWYRLITTLQQIKMSSTCKTKTLLLTL